jgi:hypothetical protein
MAKTAAVGDRFFADGYDLSGDIGAVQSLSNTRGEQDVTGLNTAGHERLQLLADGAIEFNSYYTGQATDSPLVHAHERFKGHTSMVNCTYLAGTTLGGYGYGLVAKQFAYGMERGADASLLCSVSAKAAGGTAPEWGYILEDTATSTTNENGTALDLGASHGIDDMAFYLHAVAFTGTSVTIIIQTDDNSGFSSATTYGSFTAVSGRTSQRLEVAGAPERYIRWRTNAGTFSSVTFTILACPLYD